MKCFIEDNEWKINKSDLVNACDHEFRRINQIQNDPLIAKTDDKNVDNSKDKNSNHLLGSEQSYNEIFEKLRTYSYS